ncbi:MULTISPECIES: hypothetical protein [unclassified Wolbachia]|uniref:hypothetical protein n=1 Tax=unclassified Wolbachia TaxID=2640676 RepID=UPI001E52B638|nr:MULTISPECIES: hypothetical protein [unclassified Wolbachia]UFO00477.1 hypothetical protein LOK48_00550 [Wolbachia endosymbiont of Corcyra cephalonica]
MLTNDLSNSNTPSSAPPPPPLPSGGLKNWKLPQDNKKPSNLATSGISSHTEPKKGQSKSPVQQSSLNFENNPLFKKKQEEHNVNSETADEGSKNSIHVKNPETKNSAQSKEEDNASDKTKNDRSNTKQVMPKKPMTEQHNGVHSDSENQKSSVAEQKKATGLKYSIAILLLCTSSTVAGVYTCFIILEVLSSAAVPVSSAVIAFVSALVMLSLAAYLINSHLSAINSEKGVDPGRKQSQDLQKAKGLEHSNTHTSSLSVTLGTSSAPTSPTLKNNANNKSIPSGGGKQQENGDLMADLHKKFKSRRKGIVGKDNVQQQNNEVCQNQSQDLQKAKGLEHSNTPTPSFPVIPETPIVPPPPPPSLGNNFPSGPAIDALFAEIKQGKNLMSKEKRDEIEKKRLKEQEAKKSSNSESMQQGDYMNDRLKRTVLGRRKKMYCQYEQLDSLDAQDDSLDSFEGLPTEPKKTFNKELKKPVKPLNLPIVLKNIMSSENPLLNSPSNNLLSNSSNVSDDEEWDTSQDSMSFQCDNIKQEKMKNRDNYPYSASSSTKPGEVEDSSNPPVAEIIKQLDQNKNKVISSKVDNGINTSKQQGTFVDSVELSKLTTQRPIQPGLLRVL